MFSPAVDWNQEGLEQPFEITVGVVVPPGTYDGWEAAWRFNFGWLQEAGIGLFVVFNDARGVDALDGPLNRSVVVKYSRQLTVWGG